MVLNDLYATKKSCDLSSFSYIDAISYYILSIYYNIKTGKNNKINFIIFF